jgi:hypothetical protein
MCAVLVLVLLLCIGGTAFQAYRVGWNLGLVGLLAFPSGCIGAFVAGRRTSHLKGHRSASLYFLAVILASAARSLPPLGEMIILSAVSGFVFFVILWALMRVAQTIRATQP